MWRTLIFALCCRSAPSINRVTSLHLDLRNAASEPVATKSGCCQGCVWPWASSAQQQAWASSASVTHTVCTLKIFTATLSRDNVPKARNPILESARWFLWSRFFSFADVSLQKQKKMYILKSKPDMKNLWAGWTKPPLCMAARTTSSSFCTWWNNKTASTANVHIFAKGEHCPQQTHDQMVYFYLSSFALGAGVKMWLPWSWRNEWIIQKCWPTLQTRLIMPENKFSLDVMYWKKMAPHEKWHRG